MPFAFCRRAPGDKHWKIINSLFQTILGTGALLDTENGAVQIQAQVDGNRSDPTWVMLDIMPDRFQELAQAMLDANPERATKAFGRALASGPRRPVFDEDGRELG